jgi:hypothetical protein
VAFGFIALPAISSLGQHEKGAHRPQKIPVCQGATSSGVSLCRETAKLICSRSIPDSP